jgi:ribosome-associated translation inhibitor RaiA
MKIFGLRNPSRQEHAMITNCTANDGFEISPQFRRTIEERIARLERDAEHDEALVASLIDGDHISQADAAGGHAAVRGAAHAAFPRPIADAAAAADDRAVRKTGNRE